MNNTIRIDGREIGAGCPIYIIAEMSANHGHSLEHALAVIRAAKAAGADAIKLQTYTPDTLTIDCEAPPFQIKGTLWAGKTLYQLYGDAFTPWEWHPALVNEAKRVGLQCFSSPFDPTAVDFLEQLMMPAYKIASFELVDLPLIRRVATTGKPTIMSTGMASQAEIGEALAAFREAGGKEVALLKCTSAYPSPPAEMNLRTIPHLAEKFGVPVGLSDHTLGIAAPIVAAALGARIIEKHFTLSRKEGGPDSAFSLEPAEFTAMVESVRTGEQAVGQISYEITEKERSSLVFRRSLFAVKDVKAGEPFTAENVRSIRPGHGLAPKYLGRVLQSRAARDIARGTPLAWDLVRE